MPNTRYKVSIGVKLDPPVKTALARVAWEGDHSISAVAAKAITDWLRTQRNFVLDDESTGT